MEQVTQAEVEAYILEARAAYPSMDPHDAVLRFALEEARAACERLDMADHAVRRDGGKREFRDKI